MTTPTPTPTCTRCGQALTAPVYDDAGAAYGTTCARRLGLVREPVARVRARGDVRVPRTCVDARQVELFSAAYTFVAPWLAEGFTAAQWPAVIASRARWDGSERRVVGCPGCEQFGVCGWHATGEAGREMRCVVEEVGVAQWEVANQVEPVTNEAQDEPVDR